MKNHLKQCCLCVAVAIILIVLVGSANQPPSFPEHNFGQAEVMDRVILSVIENYYDPSRINSMNMFRKTMEALQKSVAEILVSYDEQKKTATVEVLGEKVSLDIADLTSPWKLSEKIRVVFRFLEEKLPRKEYDLRSLEYGAANAMLSTLDPHSNALPPEIYESLRVDTAGQFGGLGIRITTDQRPPCKGNLTVVEVFENTPAARSGLKAGDQIVKIEGESTVNITTEEAATRLRGTPGSRVKLQIRRADGKIKSMEVRRETIPIESVRYRMLEDRVGYISLEAFQGNSAESFRQALQNLHAQKMKGLVLDLRGNPGGLLDVAIEIVDNFIDSGTIVATAGRGEDSYSVRNATSSGTEPRYPLVVLINSSSASAAEIMAGALRNHGRGLLIGSPTFGKGSVQMVQPMPAGGALKLTSAQYLTPGDISIQAVGVPADITFVPYLVSEKETDLGKPATRFSEADLEYHLDRPNARSRIEEQDVVRGILYIPSSEYKADRARYERCFVDNVDRKPFRSRYEEEFATRLIASATGVTADELLVRARQMLAEDNKKQEKAVVKALAKLGVDWSSAPEKEKKDRKDKIEPSKKVSVVARIMGKVEPGKDLKVQVTVKNGANDPIYRLRATTESDNYFLDGLDFVFGKLKPGKKKTWTTQVEVPATAAARVDAVSLKFVSDAGPVPEPVSVEVAIPDRKMPRLAYSWQFEDKNNGNGMVEPGEEVEMHVTVKNVGSGATEDAEADLSAKPGIDVVKGRFSIGKLAPGKSAHGTFSLRVNGRFPNKSAELSFTVGNWIPGRYPTSRVLLSRQIDLPVFPPSPSPEKATGTVGFKDDKRIPLFESPLKESRVIATAGGDSGFEVEATVNDFFRVKLTDGRQAWVSRNSTKPGGTGKSNVEYAFIEPPVIELQGGLVRRVIEEKVLLKGKVTHPTLVRDLIVFVGDQKLLYLPNVSTKNRGQVEFEVEVPLENGANQILVIGRHDDKTATSLPVFIRRDK